MRRWRSEASFIACFLSAVTIQTIFRGFRARNWLQVQSKSIVLLQKVMRGHLASCHAYDRMYGIMLVQAQARGWVTRFRIRRHLSQLRNEAQQKCALRLQTWWRANFSRMLYEILVSDTVLAQSTIRQFLAKQRTTKLRELRDNSSAIKIQSAWRGFQRYTDFIFLLIDIMTLQRSTRCWIARRTILELKQKRAATLFQARWRCYTAHTNYTRYRSATMLQSRWRCFSAHREYKKYCASVVIQREWRCFQAYSKYTHYRSAKLVQAQWRCYHARRKYVHFRAATEIQKQWRCFRVYARYIYTLADIIQVQSVARMWLKKRSVECMRQKRAATMIQSEWRRGKAHFLYTRNSGARKFQSAWRRYIAFTAFKQYLASRRIQTTWRRYSLNSAFTQFLSTRKIQTAWRKCTVRSAYILYMACRKVQTTWRRYSMRLAYTQFIASRRIQASSRRLIARNAYVTFISLKRIQTAWRRYSIRTAYTHYISTRRIQTVWRKYLAHSSYRNYFSARKVQASWRRYALRSAYSHYITARTIQTAWRRYADRSAYVMYISSRRIQTAWRCHTLRSAYLVYRAATKIQAAWRKLVALADYNEYKAARDIQACYRMHCGYKRYVIYRAASKIQAIWRGHVESANYFSFRAVTKIQTAWRRYAVLTVYRQFRSATKIQTAWRRRSAYSNYVHHCSARKIQCAWRGFRAATDYILALADIIRAQSVIRSWLSKRRLHLRKRGAAAATIQAGWRRLHDFKNYKEYKAAQRVQKTWRMRCAVQDYAQFKAASTIQAVWRMHNTFTDYCEYQAATKIQKSWRRLCVTKKLLEFKAAAYIQKEWRRWKASAEYAVSFLRIIIAQSAARSYLARKQYYMLQQTRLMEVSATVIQKCIRRHFVEMQVQADLVSIILAQSSLRRFLARQAAKRIRCANAQNAAVIGLQALARRVLALRLASDMRTRNKYETAVVLVQTIVRRYNASTLAQRMLCQVKSEAAIKIQSLWRGFWEFSHYVILQYEVVRMQAMARGKLYRKKFNLKLGCCIMIQAAVRKFLVKNQFKELCIPRALAMAKACALREVLACIRIQFWWKVVMECRREKRAALKIESFVMKHLENKEKEKRLKKAWSENSDLFAFSSDSNNSDIFDFSKSPGLQERKRIVKSPLQQSDEPKSSSSAVGKSPKIKSPAFRHSSSDHIASSPDKRMVMRHARDSPSSKSKRSSREHSVGAEPDVASSLRRAKEVMNRARISDRADEAFLDAVATSSPPAMSTRSRKSPNKASRDHMYTSSSASLSRRSSSGKKHAARFFADDLESEVSAVLEQAASTTRSTKSSRSKASLYLSERSLYNFEDTGYESLPPVFAKSSVGHGFELTSTFSPSNTIRKSRSRHSEGGEVITPCSMVSKSRSRYSEAGSSIGMGSPRRSPRQPPPKSPRHANILVLKNPYPDYARNSNATNYEDYLGEEYGEV